MSALLPRVWACAHDAELPRRNFDADGEACLPRSEAIADDTPVNGGTLEQVRAATSGLPPIELRWGDNTTTTATAALTVVPGTARRVRSPYCRPECWVKHPERWEPWEGQECTSDWLRADALVTISTTDGRVAGATWVGSVNAACAADGRLRWGFDGHGGPNAPLGGWVLAAVRAGATDLVVRSWVYGGDLATPVALNLDANFRSVPNAKRRNEAVTLGRTPRDPDRRYLLYLYQDEGDPTATTCDEWPALE